MGRGGTSAREISFVSLVAYGPNSDSALTMGVTASETRQGSSQHLSTAKENRIKMKKEATIQVNIFSNDTLDKGLISKVYKEHI